MNNTNTIKINTRGKNASEIKKEIFDTNARAVALNLGQGNKIVFEVNGYKAVVDNTKYGDFIRCIESKIFDRKADRIEVAGWIDIWNAKFKYKKCDEYKLEGQDCKEIDFKNVQYFMDINDRSTLLRGIMCVIDVEALFSLRDSDYCKLHIVADNLKLNRYINQNYEAEANCINIDALLGFYLDYSISLANVKYLSSGGYDLYVEEYDSRIGGHHMQNLRTKIVNLAVILDGLKAGEIGYDELATSKQNNGEITYGYRAKEFEGLDRNAEIIDRGYTKATTSVNFFDESVFREIIREHGFGKVRKYYTYSDVALDYNRTLNISFDDMLALLDKEDSEWNIYGYGMIDEDTMEVTLVQRVYYRHCNWNYNIKGAMVSSKVIFKKM